MPINMVLEGCRKSLANCGKSRRELVAFHHASNNRGSTSESLVQVLYVGDDYLRPPLTEESDESFPLFGGDEHTYSDSGSHGSDNLTLNLSF